MDSFPGMTVLGVAAMLVVGAAAIPPYRVDVAGMDRSVDPGNDFYEFANGGWMKSTEIPPDRSALGSFTIIDEEVNRRLRELLEAATVRRSRRDGGRLLRRVHGRGGDREARSRAGEGGAGRDRDDRGSDGARAGSRIADCAPTSTRSTARTSTRAGSSACGRRRTSRIPSGTWATCCRAVSECPTATTTATPTTRRGAAGEVPRPHRRRPRSSRRCRTPRRARAGSTTSRRRSPTSTSAGPTRWTSTRRTTPGRSRSFRSGRPGSTGRRTSRRPASSPSRCSWSGTPPRPSGSPRWRASEPLETWKDYLTFHASIARLALLPHAFADEQFRFYGTALTGRRKPRDRWKRAVSATSAALGDAVGRLYVRAATSRRRPRRRRRRWCATSWRPSAAASTRSPGWLAGHAREGEGEARRPSTSASAIPSAGRTTRG